MAFHFIISLYALYEGLPKWRKHGRTLALKPYAVDGIGRIGRQFEGIFLSFNGGLVRLY